MSICWSKICSQRKYVAPEKQVAAEWHVKCKGRLDQTALTLRKADRSDNPVEVT